MSSGSAVPSSRSSPARTAVMTSTICAAPCARALHVESVRDRQAVEAELVAQKSAQHRLGQARRQLGIAGQRGQGW